MTEPAAPTPAMYRAEGTDSFPDLPALLGGRCRDCDYVFLPMQAYGCERCGSLALEPVALSGRGTLIASAEVYMDPGPHRQAPFTVGSIVTVDGAVIRAILDVPPGGRLEPGAVVVSGLVSELRPDGSTLGLRFAPTGEA